MSETKKSVVEGAQTTTKKVRRGVSNKTQAVAQLKFHEKDAAQNGLFVGHLESVSVEWFTDANGKEFTGEKVPRLVFHFTSNHANASEKRHVYQSLIPVPSNVNTIPEGIESWKVDNVFNWIKHILDVFYLKGRELTEEEEEALSLTFDDTDENGEYVSVEVADVLAGYRSVFENACAMLNGQFNLADGEIAKPCFKTSDGKFIPCWLKLLRHKKRKNDWINVTSNGDLGFDGFIGNGVVELMRKDMPPTVLRLDLSKESITPKETKKQPTIGAPGMAPGIGGVAVDPMAGMAGNYDAAAVAGAGDEMPF